MGKLALLFVQIAFEKSTTNLYFENGEDRVKTTITNLWLLVSIDPACSSIFMQRRFQWKRAFIKLTTFFISSTGYIFTRLFVAPESLIKINVSSL